MYVLIIYIINNKYVSTLSNVSDITEEEMKAYLNQVFNPIFIEAFLYGNCDESVSIRLLIYRLRVRSGHCNETVL